MAVESGIVNHDELKCISKFLVYATTNVPGFYLKSCDEATARVMVTFEGDGYRYFGANTPLPSVIVQLTYQIHTQASFQRL